MKQFQDKVAVVTGAASGIGHALAEKSAAEGMKVVLADVEVRALNRVAGSLEAAGATVLAVLVDVSQADQVAALAERTIDEFGGVHLLFNNAGVAAGGPIWDSTLADWEWVLGVNMWGVIHGIRAFVPLMLAQDSEGHIVNTASVAGLLPYHPSAPYHVSKHAVIGLTENLYNTLVQSDAKLRASVLCPGWVQTQIIDAERNRPQSLQNPPVGGEPDPMVEAVINQMRDQMAQGMLPAELADLVFEAIRQEQLYILTDPAFNDPVRQRHSAILPPDA